MASVFLFVMLLVGAAALGVPEQLHLSYGYSPSQMFVMWSTDQNSTSKVFHTPAPAKQASNWTLVQGECWNFSYGNPDGLQMIHRVNLTVSLIDQQMYSCAVHGHVTFLEGFDSRPDLHVLC